MMISLRIMIDEDNNDIDDGDGGDGDGNNYGDDQDDQDDELFIILQKTYHPTKPG